MLSSWKSTLKVSVLSLMLIFSLIEASLAHDNPGYYYGTKQKTSNPSWMTSLKDDTLLSQLSIPGTHDSMALYGGLLAQTQSLSLETQLNSGIRVLDIRCRHIEDIFAIHHGSIFEKAYFGEVLETVTDFLQAHPGETVLMRVKEEDTAKKTTRSFDETFKDKYWSVYGKNFMYQGSSNNPKLSEMRGKIVILQNWSGGDYGIPYSSALNIQDEYELKNNYDLYHKWDAVKDQLEAANSGDSNTIYMNYLSGSTKTEDVTIPSPVFPYFVASGHSDPRTDAPRELTGKTTPGWKHCCKDFPRIDCALGICSIAFEGTNILTYERLGKSYKTRVGMIMADFPGPGLIERIIELNDVYKK